MSAPRYEIGYGGPEYDRLVRELYDRLGGRNPIFARPHFCDLERLAARGVLLTPAGVRLRPGRLKDCHGNAQRLARVGERRAYGLGLNGAWIEHSWLVAPDGYVVETTFKMEKYFGIVSRRPVRVAAIEQALAAVLTKAAS